jgi:hypothetical protein
MPDRNTLTLRQADQARSDFALIESNLELLAGQLARLPTRRDLAKAALGIIISTAALVICGPKRFGAYDAG